MKNKVVVNAGDKFNFLTVIREVLPIITVSKNRLRYNRMVLVTCDCGSSPKVINLYSMIHNKVLSCGCHRKKIHTKHNQCYTTTYNTWSGLVQRCTNPNDKKYHLYGGFGVSVCDRWRESFENFYEDMGDRPKGMTLNRVNGSKVYSKQTCEWANSSKQSYDQKINSRNTSGVTGVSKYNEKWAAEIMKDKKKIFLGYFLDFNDAVRAREEAELLYYGFNKKHNIGNIVGGSNGQSS